MSFSSQKINSVTTFKPHSNNSNFVIKRTDLQKQQNRRAKDGERKLSVLVKSEAESQISYYAFTNLKQKLIILHSKTTFQF